MNILSQSSFIASFVFVTSIFNSVDAAKTMHINLLPGDVARMEQASFTVTTREGEKNVNVLSTLIEFYQKNPALFELLLNFYNSIKSGTVKDTVIPEELLKQMSPELVAIICINDGSVFKLNPAIYDALDLLATSIKDGIDAAKAKTCKECCGKFWYTTAPKFLLMTVQLVAPILLAIASGKKSAAENFIITIPTSFIKYGKIVR